MTILKLGLNDRSNLVTTVVKDKLIPAWINAMEGSIFALLRGLDVEGCSDLAAKVLQVWFKTLNYKEITALLSMKQDHLLEIEELKPETALYWRTAVQFLQSEGVHASEELDTIQPEMTAFGKYIKSYVTGQLNHTDDMAEVSCLSVNKAFKKFSSIFFSCTAAQHGVYRGPAASNDTLFRFG